ncbi:tyrosine/phenylalanine carboxypeptidase domain-containing protein [Christiangramia sp.]|uniref:flavohemoglobin expression-modulating QEGLA motif protein n=1 Tax=Christiangramia sp. TaxID=1931228 RepID=UPI0026128F32|nr:tyrosine/phenylalanine carboxypeptidase domain-containing protein [Christiangramia sp.]
MQEIPDLSENSIEQILTILEKENEISCQLPGKGVLHIEKELPYLVIYRRKENDKGTRRFVTNESSYLVVGTEDFEGYQKLLYKISDQISAETESFLLFEIYAGDPNSSKIRIKGPAQKLPTTLDTLKENFLKVNSEFTGIYLDTEIVDTPHRQPEGEAPLMKVEDAKSCGAVVVGLEIPPIYRNGDNELYPVFFRNFKDFLIEAIHRSFFEFIRVQTSGGVASFNALGRKYLKQIVFDIDKQLADIERSYQFLWLVSPANIHDIKKKFFESDYQKVIDYHYRLLPIDPDVLKRKLYNLKIEDIDDPAMSYLFREKREELDMQISMLNERGTTNFMYDSIRLYKGVENSLCEEARKILSAVEEETEIDEEDLLDSKAFSSMARKEFDYFREQDENFKCRVHIRKDVNVMMVSHGELYIPADYKMKRIEAEALIQHEVGTHVLTYYNGSNQPLNQLSIGLADYDPLQEGLAVMSEFMVDGLTANRLRILAGRVIAGEALMEGGNFQEIFRLLKLDYGFSPERAFNITSRIMQGGGFLKDIIYLKGLVLLKEYLKNGGEYEPLLAGKYGIKHTDIIKELTDRKVLKPVQVKPSYLHSKKMHEKLNLIRKGLSLPQMVCK